MPANRAESIIAREQAARHLGVGPEVLAHYEARGLIQAVRIGDIEGYEPAEVRRIWSVLSLHREAGVNLAGVECILRLREQLDALHAQVGRLARALHELVEAELAEADAER
jgi:MerR family transcriptional regulator/heat shock protein HspR